MTHKLDRLIGAAIGALALTGGFLYHDVTGIAVGVVALTLAAG